MHSETDEMDAISTYMLTLFLSQVAKRTNGRCDYPQVLPAFISDDCARDCESITNSMVDAFIHPGLFLHKFHDSSINIGR